MVKVSDNDVSLENTGACCALCGTDSRGSIGCLPRRGILTKTCVSCPQFIGQWPSIGDHEPSPPPSHEFGWAKIVSA